MAITISETVLEILPQPQPGPFMGEDSQQVVEALAPERGSGGGQ